MSTEHHTPPEGIPRPQARSRSLVDYWDDFYAQHHPDEPEASASLEWIVHPDGSLFAQLLPFLTIPQTSHESCCDMLEIGCGTSTLSRDLYVYLTTDQGHRPDSISITATDVSEYAIQNNRNRDAGLPTANGNQATSVRYLVWNVLTDPPQTVLDRRVPVILDKGCLDTILFRSDKRMIPKLAADFLNHVWQALTLDGIYLVITPRRKHTLLHSFRGFASVERLELACDKEAEIYKAETNARAFLHVCRRSCDYEPQDQQGAFVTKTQTIVHEACPSCGLLEKDFRCQGRDRCREWAGHCTHCK